MDFHILLFVLVGFIAQLIDGALGMAYGVSSNTFLLSIGIPPAAASASIHMAECVTTAVSGASHWKLGNIDKTLIKKLLIPGVLGGIAGAYVLTSLDGNAIKPYVSAYLILMGIIILVKAIRKNHAHKEVRSHLIPLGLVGGFFDAVGGGGWGPIVTTTLVARGHAPRFAIGSVNLSEFFVTFAQSATFLMTLGMLDTWKIIIGLLVGGVMAAPLAAVAARKLPTRILMSLVGILIIVLSVRTIVLTLR
jgi:hypothetical protein